MAKTPFDPTRLPIEAIAGEAAVLLEHLAPDWLRQRFAAPPEWTPEPSEPALGVHRGEPTPASVLVPLVLREDGVHLLLTMRTAHLNDHAGQVAFPGGRAEPTDADAVDTALRETEEEIGLDRRHIDVIGSLPLYYTGTGYAVTPVVGLVTPPFDMKADPFEVAEIFEVPFQFLMDGANHQRLAAELPSGRRTFYAMPYQNYFIWGATAGMLRNLFHFLRA